LAAKSQKGERLDVIFSDWNMPGITGLDLLKFSKTLPGIDKVPFVMVTATYLSESV
jgi:two-component system chemotaxis response regulator CheY